jgi:hypothetical protein
VVEESVKNIQVKYRARPRKNAFVIKDNDIASLEAAVKTATFSWGGFFSGFFIDDNLNNKNPLDLEIINKIDPDHFINLGGLRVEPFDKFLNRHVDGISDVTAPSGSSNLFIPSIGYTLNEILEKRTDLHKFCLLTARPSRRNLYHQCNLFSFGLLPDETITNQLLMQRGIIYKPVSSYFNIKQVDYPSSWSKYVDFIISCINENNLCPINLSNEGIDYSKTLTHSTIRVNDFYGKSDDYSVNERLTIIVSRNKSFEDLFFAWNLRTLNPFGVNIHIVPYKFFKQVNFSDYLKKLTNYLFTKKLIISTNVDIVSKTISAKILARYISGPNIKIRNPEEIVKSSGCVDIGQVVSTMGSSDGYSVSTTSTKPSIGLSKAGVYSIDLDIENLLVPLSMDIDRYPYAGFDSRSSSFGWTIDGRINESHNNQTILIPNKYEVLKAYCLDKGIDIDISEPGRLGKVFELSFNEDSFHRLKIVSNKKVYNLLQSLSYIRGTSLLKEMLRKELTPVVEKWKTKFGTKSEQITTILNNITSLQEDILNNINNEKYEKVRFKLGRLHSALGINNEDVGILVEWLIEKNIMCRSLEVVCKHCKSKILVDHFLGKQVSCPKCSKDFKYTNTDEHITWLYALSELWAEIFASDLFPILLSLLRIEFQCYISHGRFLSSFGGGWTGVKFNISSQSRAKNDLDFEDIEIDLAAFIDRRLALGEAKLKAKAFLSKDGISQLSKQFKLANVLNTGYYILICLDDFSGKQKKYLERLAKKNNYVGKLIFYDSNILFNQEAVPTKAITDDQHIDSMVKFLRHWQERDINTFYR